MKDLTSASLGLTIAYLLPGLAIFYGLSFWFDPIQKLFNTFLTADSNGGLFLLVTLASIALSLQLSALRWIFFEKIILFCWRLKKEDFEKLGEDKNLDAFRGAVDEHYRYHQFYGAFSFILPFYYYTLKHSPNSFLHVPNPKLVTIVLTILTTLAAMDSYIKYTNRAKAILK